ncbi:MAG: (2Fe-2S) ferredoxin domain-containing protein [Chitinophagaceae bacterium]
MAIKDLTKIKRHIFFCNGESCKKKGAAETTETIRAAVERNGLSDLVHTTKTMCNGRCKDAPVMIAFPEGYWFKRMDASKAEKFVDDFLKKGKVQSADILYVYGSEDIMPAEKASIDLK